MQTHQDELSGIRRELERLQRENRELSSDRRRLEMVLSGAGAGTWDWNLGTDEVAMNKQWAAMIGYTLEEISPTSLETFKNHCHPEDLKCAFAVIQEHLEGKRDHYECEIRMRHRDGRWIHVLDRGSIVERDGKGRPTRLAGSHIDITERKKSTDELARKEWKYRAMFENIQDVYAEVEAESGLILEISPSIERYGYSREELLHTSIADYYPYPEERLLLYEQLREHRRVVDHEVHFRTKSGELRVFSFTVEMIEGSEVLPAKIVGTMRDVTIRKRNEEQIQENVRLKNSFLSTVSHELRTPLFSILGFSSALLKGKETIDSATREEFLNIIHDESARLSILIEDILTISRIDAGNSRYHPVVLNPAPLIDDVVKILQRMAAEKEIMINKALPPEGVHITFDRDAFRQVLTNLVGNAIKYSLRGGSVVIGLEEKNGQALLSVSDDGVGIPAEDLTKIFEQFYRSAHSAHRAHGTGLGLAIVRDLVEAHGGTIDASSTLDEGSTFTLSLPAASPSAG
ncbi:ATP-binding protein [Chlorobium sp. N1]|uniref:PAS domain-containing sensor histidine kinase n=1 Tax=Chlorobium sp. N1 TaxID=2491138 RepID=UPI0013F1679F|nr:ATP-binding protein [Chlorobium sp. N1]